MLPKFLPVVLLVAAAAKSSATPGAEPYIFVPASALTLVEMPEVGRDLGLSPVQRTFFRLLKPQLDGEFKPRFDAARREVEREFGDVVNEYWRQADARVLAALVPDQRVRLAALQCQSVGFRALLWPALRDRLTLDPGQVAALDRLSRSVIERRSACVKGFFLFIPMETGEAAKKAKAWYKGQLAAQGEALATIEREAEAGAIALLTPDQAVRYRRLLGAALPAAAGSAFSVTLIAVD